MADQPPFPVIDGKYQMEKEPLVHIGVVLAEDGKHQVRFQVPREGYRMQLDGTEQYLDLRPGVELRVEADANWVQLLDEGPFAAGTPRKTLRLIPPQGAEPKNAGDGVKVQGVVAGRGFHWEKTIDQTLSDVLEFQGRDGHVIMVNELPLETYLIGVITGEMSGECPIEFMKSQAVAARSWLLGQPRDPHPGEPFLWCNDDCCQRYQGTGGWSGRAVQAIDECRGEVLITRGKKYCDARYSKNTGGVSEDADFIWGEEIEGLEGRLDAPEDSYARKFYPVTEENVEEYIRGEWLKDCQCYASPNVISEEEVIRFLGRVDEAGSYFRWRVTLNQDQLRGALRSRGGIEDLEAVHDLVTGPRGKGGRQEYLTVVYRASGGEMRERRIKSDYNIRAGLSKKFLYSSAFLVDADKNEKGEIKEVRLDGAGWGHGAGLCQMGGLGRAVKGQDYKTILHAYYTGVTLERIYD